MTVTDITAAHAQRQRALGRQVAKEVGRLWRFRLDPRNIAVSWARMIPQALGLLTTGQTAAARASDDHNSDIAAAYGVPDDPAGQVAPAAFAGTASDGRDLATLLYRPAINALTLIGQGVDADQALASSEIQLDLIARTQVADAGRTADQVGVVVRRHFTGYVRMLVGNSCSRCIVLTDRVYQWNSGFQRHPGCDCVHIPVAEATDEEMALSARQVFDRMPEAEQDRVFTKAGAQAIRDGADIGQVVNARRGARGLTPAGARLTGAEQRLLRDGRDRGSLQRANVNGLMVFTTTEGRSVRGVAGRRLAQRGGTEKIRGARYQSARAARLMPESIYEMAAGDRGKAIRMLRTNGYIF